MLPSLARSAAGLRSSRPHRTLAGKQQQQSQTPPQPHSPPTASSECVAGAGRAGRRKASCGTSPCSAPPCARCGARALGRASLSKPPALKLSRATAWRLRASTGLGGNAGHRAEAAAVVDQTEDLRPDTGWTSSASPRPLKTFLRELREPLIPSATFQRQAQRQNASQSGRCCATLPPAHYNTLRLLFHHLTRVVQCSERNQMSSQNVALMMGPNLVWPASGDADGGLCLTSNLMFQN
uniref:Rho-GAP domain-containing protein n=1 Tax=Macrostomum lignano TaxID=282301 RepID=A0A1I8FB69_9PLAT